MAAAWHPGQLAEHQRERLAEAAPAGSVEQGSSAQPVLQALRQAQVLPLEAWPGVWRILHPRRHHLNLDHPVFQTSYTYSNVTDLPRSAYFLLFLPSEKRAKRDPTDFLAGASISRLPVTTCASVSNAAAVSLLGSVSEIICPLLAAKPKRAGSKGRIMVGEIPKGWVKSSTEISGRLGTLH